MTTITLTHKGKAYTAESCGWQPSCAGCAFHDGPGRCSLPSTHPDKSKCIQQGIIWIEQQESPLDMPGFKAQKAYNGCCGQPNTCEQPCFHQSGRTTPGQPGGIASVPQSQADVRSSDDWVKWDGGVTPATGMVEVRYRNGMTNTDDADSFLWEDRNHPDDIVAYRIAIPAPQYDPRDVSFNPLDKQVGGNHYRDNSAPGFLREAISVMEQRGQQYDTEGGERSFAAAADTFNAITGYEITAADVALVQVCIKLVRSQSRAEPHRDSLLDAVAYMALHGEERMKEGAWHGITPSART